MNLDVLPVYLLLFAMVDGVICACILAAQMRRTRAAHARYRIEAVLAMRALQDYMEKQQSAWRRLAVDLSTNRIAVTAPAIADNLRADLGRVEARDAIQRAERHAREQWVMDEIAAARDARPRALLAGLRALLP